MNEYGLRLQLQLMQGCRNQGTDEELLPSILLKMILLLPYLTNWKIYLENYGSCPPTFNQLPTTLQETIKTIWSSSHDLWSSKDALNLCTKTRFFYYILFETNIRILLMTTIQLSFLRFRFVICETFLFIGKPLKDKRILGKRWIGI